MSLPACLLLVTPISCSGSHVLFFTVQCACADLVPKTVGAACLAKAASPYTWCCSLHWYRFTVLTCLQLAEGTLVAADTSPPS